MQSTMPTSYPTLTDPVDTDVAVVGGGIAGLCIAWTLARAGRRVTLLESGRLAEATTGNTTAKVTALHRTIYNDLGGKADLYAQSQLAAIGQITAAVADIGVDCDLEARVAYTYATSEKGARALRDEATAAAAAGLPAEFVTTTPLPFEVSGAVRVTGQAQFHPRKFLLALADDLTRQGGRIYENSRVVEIADGHVTIESGALVRADDIVVATGFPAFDRPELFTRLVPARELVVAAPIPSDADPDGMFIGTDDGRSVRTAPLDEGRRLLIVTGEIYQPGEGGVEDRFTALADWMRDQFPTADAQYRWSAQDYATSDKIPFVGRYPGRDKVWVATGFGGWGMTNAMMSAHLLTARITGAAVPQWADLYDPHRLHPLTEAPSLVKAAATVMRNLVGERIGHPQATPADLEPSQGAVVTMDGQRCAAFRDDDGKLHTVSATCTHLGCIVGFNDADKTWECPCHGSRFDVDGAVLQGPALKPLPRVPHPS
jgi:glycine/D-amino acid oxidase-like deaminating enzyme/nitrite reductase/ring-hydroxylating ferredoxin subunit